MTASCLAVWTGVSRLSLSQSDQAGSIVRSQSPAASRSRGIRVTGRRHAGAAIVFLTGSEISLFTDGFLPGNTAAERLHDPQRLRAALQGLPATINAFLGEAVTAVRAQFGGRIGYASLPLEDVDWAPFGASRERRGSVPLLRAERLRRHRGARLPAAANSTEPS